jgi:hypothetical protein
MDYAGTFRRFHAVLAPVSCSPLVKYEDKPSNAQVFLIRRETPLSCMRKSLRNSSLPLG